MKKILTVIAVLLVLFLLSTFIFIPRHLTVSKVTIVKANENAIMRNLSDYAKWKKWWPSKKILQNQKTFYRYNDFTYNINRVLYRSVKVNTINGSHAFDGEIVIIPIAPDSVAVQWKSDIETSANPFTKILKYQQAKAMRSNMEVILKSFKAFNENTENLYAFNIHRTTIKDTFLVATKITANHYPSTKEVYDLVANLQKYIGVQGARETNYPMLNVTAVDSTHYTAMVAIPTDKELAGTANISLKRMIIYRDKIIVAEIKGGPETIKKAYKELNLYMQDYNLTSPVIHWESLITDRSKETDSAKWITHIFMPIV